MKRLLVLLLLPGMALAEPEFSNEANNLLQLCRFGWAGPERVESYARTEDHWAEGTEGDTVLELVFYDEDLAELRQYDGTEHYDSQTIVCFRQGGWPIVAVTSEWFVGHQLCSATGFPIPLPPDGSLQLRVQKMTRFAASGLFSTEMTVLLGDQPQPPEAYCGPALAVAGFLQPFEYLGPADQVLQMLDGIRAR